MQYVLIKNDISVGNHNLVKDEILTFKELTEICMKAFVAFDDVVEHNSIINTSPKNTVKVFGVRFLVKEIRENINKSIGYITKICTNCIWDGVIVDYFDNESIVFHNDNDVYCKKLYTECNDPYFIHEGMRYHLSECYRL